VRSPEEVDAIIDTIAAMMDVEGTDTLTPAARAAKSAFLASPVFAKTRGVLASIVLAKKK
jgi:hypothetical protein